MRVYKPAYTKALPAGAKIKAKPATERRKAYDYVIVRDKQGQLKECRLIETAKGRRVVVESNMYTVTFKDHAGTERRVQAYRDRGRSEELRKTIGLLVYYRERSEILPADLQQKIDDLPEGIHRKLASFGLLRRRRMATSQDMEEMLEEFERYLAIRKQREPKYVRETLAKLRRAFMACGFQTFTDIDEMLLDKYLVCLREKQNVATRTLNGYIRSCQQFCRYAIRVLKVSRYSPLECMESFGSEAADRRRIRRALTADEIHRLLTTTGQSPVTRFGMDGQERSILYKFALMTGLRLNEIRTLSVEHLDLDHPEGPILYVDAAYSKHREHDTLPLHRDLVSDLRQFILHRGKTPQAKLFGGKYQALTDKAARMLRMDLADADVEYKTVAGEVDFHALRHTYVSSLKSISSRLAQGLARHKSSEMTDRYSHRSLAEQRAALESVSMFGLTG